MVRLPRKRVVAHPEAERTPMPTAAIPASACRLPTRDRSTRDCPPVIGRQSAPQACLTEIGSRADELGDWRRVGAAGSGRLSQ